MNHEAVIAFLQKQGYEVIDEYKDAGCDVTVLVLGETEVSVRAERLNVDELSAEDTSEGYEE